MTKSAILLGCIISAPFSTGFGVSQHVSGILPNRVKSLSMSSNNNIDPLANDVQVRRQAFRSIFESVIIGGAIANFAPSKSFALDMDAFVNQELANDEAKCNPKLDSKCIPKLSTDEALCKYGQSGSSARSEACKRVKSGGGSLPEKTKEKSLGGAYAM